MSKQLEIGNLYRLKNPAGKHIGGVYLAVTEDLLCTVEKQTLMTMATTISLHVERDVNVEGLCKEWGITLSMLDEISDAYLKPVEHRNTNTRQRVKRSDTKHDDRTEALLLRLHRIVFRNDT